MTKKPNKLGRIEGEPKMGRWEKTKIVAHNSLFVIVPVLLVVLGVASTLGYQNYVNDLKAEGVSQYKLDKCEKFTDKKQTSTWLECDV